MSDNKEDIENDNDNFEEKGDDGNQGDDGDVIDFNQDDGDLIDFDQNDDAYDDYNEQEFEDGRPIGLDDIEDDEKLTQEEIEQAIKDEAEYDSDFGRDQEKPIDWDRVHRERYDMGIIDTNPDDDVVKMGPDENPLIYEKTKADSDEEEKKEELPEGWMIDPKTGKPKKKFEIKNEEQYYYDEEPVKEKAKQEDIKVDDKNRMIDVDGKIIDWRRKQIEEKKEDSDIDEAEKFGTHLWDDPNVTSMVLSEFAEELPIKYKEQIWDHFAQWIDIDGNKVEPHTGDDDENDKKDEKDTKKEETPKKDVKKDADKDDDNKNSDEEEEDDSPILTGNDKIPEFDKRLLPPSAIDEIFYTFLILCIRMRFHDGAAEEYKDIVPPLPTREDIAKKLKKYKEFILKKSNGKPYTWDQWMDFPTWIADLDYLEFEDDFNTQDQDMTVIDNLKNDEEDENEDHS